MVNWAASGGGGGGAAAPDARRRRRRLVRWGALAAVAVLAAGALPAGAQNADPPMDSMADTPAADDASLSSLSLSGVDFGGFSPDVADYAANVAADVSVTTVTATAANTAASVSVSPADADADTVGHQVSLAPGRNWVRVSVGSADGNVQQQYTVVVMRDPGPAMTRNPDKDIKFDFDNASARDPDNPQLQSDPRLPYVPLTTGLQVGLLFGQGTTLWGSDARTLFAYDLESGLPSSGRHLRLANVPNSIYGLWSDGTTMWASPGYHEFVIQAYEAKTGERTPDRDIDTELCCYPVLRGIWSDGDTMWVVDDDVQDLRAYDLATGDRRPNSDIELGEIYKAMGLWSDGKTIWVTASRGGFGEAEYGEIRAYDLESGERVPELDFGELDYMFRTTGIWSDGATMWAGDGRWGTQIWAFNMPQSGLLSWLDVSDAHIPFAADRFDYLVQAPDGVSRVTLSAAAAFSSSEVSFSVADADAAVGGVQVDLAEGLNTVVVTSANGDDTRTYTLRINAGDPPPPLPSPPSAALSSLAVSGVELAFSADQLTYASEVGADVESVTVSAVAADERASVTVLPADADSVTDVHEVSLSVGANVVTITVVAGEDILTYTVVLTRPANDSDGSDDAVGGESDGDGPESLQQEESDKSESGSEQRSDEQRSESESDVSESGSVGPPVTASFEELPAAHGGAGTDLAVRVRFSEPLAVGVETMRGGWALFVGSPHELVGARRVGGASDVWEFTVRVGDDERLRLTVFKGTGCDGRHAVCTADGRPVSNSLVVFVEGPDTGGGGDDGDSGEAADDQQAGDEQQGDEQQGDEQEQVAVVRAEDEIGAVVLSSGAAGELTVSWEAPVLAPFEYRVMWARDDLDYLSYWQPDEAHRGNARPAGDAASVTLAGLEEGAVYKVQIRARFRDEKGKVSASPWTAEHTATVTASSQP